jgi:hypothetical protein
MYIIPASYQATACCEFLQSCRTYGLTNFSYQSCSTKGDSRSTIQTARHPKYCKTLPVGAQRNTSPLTAVPRVQIPDHRKRVDAYTPNINQDSVSYIIYLYYCRTPKERMSSTWLRCSTELHAAEQQNPSAAETLPVISNHSYTCNDPHSPRCYSPTRWGIDAPLHCRRRRQRSGRTR